LAPRPEVAAQNTVKPTLDQWQEWQSEVVSLLRRYFHGELSAIAIDDVDWPSWYSFFIQGRSPQEAIDRALERDL
jgi:hypothetical protein